MNRLVELKVNKCPIPIIWLDTSVLINMTKNRLGKAKNSPELVREKRLLEAILQQVRKSELICPQADQLEEVTHSFGDILETQMMLSRGIQLRHGDEIREIQLHHAMRANINDTGKIEVNYQDAFDYDPIAVLREKEALIVDVFSNKSARLLELEESKKLYYLVQYNVLKIQQRESKRSFQEQLEIEFTGGLQAAYVVLRKLRSFRDGNLLPTEEDLSQMLVFDNQIIAWDRFGGKPQGLEGLMKFYLSTEWRLNPSNDISAHMFAKLITKDGAIKPGDPKDINQLAVALAYCNIVVCDRAMKNLIAELKLDMKYRVNVYSIADVDEILCSILSR